MADLSASETRTEFEEQKRTVCELQERLADAEFQLIEGEKLRKKLHNTILVILFSSFLESSSSIMWLVLKCLLLQELKGNIRVFCRVRPLLPEDGVGTEATVIAYPTSTETLGRGIDLVQSGMFLCL